MNKKQKLVSRWALGLVLLLASAHAMAQSTVTYVYTDQQGTPLAEADANGNITATFDYAPYGSQALGNAPNGPGYTGHVNDPDTGLVYMQARYYDSATGRFLSVDPVGPAAGNAFNFSRYAYADNNPVGNTDPTGMAPGDADDNYHSAFPYTDAYFGGNGASVGTSSSQSSSAGSFEGQSQVNYGTPYLQNKSDQPSTASQMANALSTGLDVTDVALSGYMLRAPSQIGYWQMGNLAVSRYIGASWQDMAQYAKVGKVANGVAFLAIGSSTFSLVQAARNRDQVGAIGAGSDLAWSLFGLTGPVGAVGSTFYGATSLMLRVPAVNSHVVQPVANFMCLADSSCR